MSGQLAYLFSLEQFGIKLGLENIRALVAALGNPQTAFKSVHIAGTNGKGSVTAMIDSVLRAAGHRTARYTSPHLVHLRERFVVDGEMVSAAALDSAIDRVREAVNRLQTDGVLDVSPTFFEATTAVAFDLFRQGGVEIAVCEVGLGGRLDATNVLEPVVTAITSIALDHERHLGYTVAEIAVEKAGIIKPGVPVVVGAVPEAARDVIAGIAAARGARLVSAPESAWITRDPADVVGTRVAARTISQDYGSFILPLVGAHQLDNAAVALRVIEELEAAGVRIGADAVRRGLSSTRWPGRLETLTLRDGREALLDAAHNPAGAAALASYLGDRRERRPLVFAAMRDKDADGILRALAPVVGMVVMTRASNTRSADPDALAAILKRIAPDMPVEVADRPVDALARAWAHAPRIVVAGSIFLLGDVIEAIEPS